MSSNNSDGGENEIEGSNTKKEGKINSWASAHEALSVMLQGWLGTDPEQERDYQAAYNILKEFPVLAMIYFNEEVRSIGPTGGPMTLEGEAFPLSFLLVAKAPLCIIQDVYEIHPDALSNRGIGSADLPLHRAIQHGNSLEVISFLIGKCKKAVWEQGQGGFLPIHNLLQRFGTVPEDFFFQTAKLLGEADSSCIWKRHRLLEEHTQSFAFFALSSPQTPKWFLIWLAQLGGLDCFQIYHDLDKFGQTHRREQFLINLKVLVSNLRKPLEFSYCHSDKFDFVERMISELEFPFPSPAEVSFRSCSFRSPDTGAVANGQPIDWSKCQIRRLSLERCRVPFATLNGFLKKVAQLPSLKELHFENYNHIISSSTSYGGDITSAVIEVLQGKHLDYFRIRGPTGLLIDDEKVIQFLSNSDTTVFVNALGHDQWTNARHLGPNSLKKRPLEISYLSSLNRHGRAKISGPRASPTQLVQGLQSLQRDTRVPEDLKLAVRYGLLRANPGLWAVPSALKRKASKQLSVVLAKKAKGD